MCIPVLLCSLPGNLLFLLEHLPLPLYLPYLLLNLHPLISYLSLPLDSLLAPVPLPLLISLLLLHPLQLRPEPPLLRLLRVTHRLTLPLQLQVSQGTERVYLTPLSQVLLVLGRLCFSLGLDTSSFLGTGQKGTRRLGFLISHLLNAVESRFSGKIFKETSFVFTRTDHCC